MRLSVTQNRVEIIEKGIVNQGEYRVTECEFDFVGAFDGLVKKAIFTDKATNKAYEMPILDDACMIPAEVLAGKGVCTIGVYAYDTYADSDELALRYSPTPVTVTIEAGSYKKEVENPCDIKTSQAEQYEAKINTKIAEVDAVVDEVKEKLANGDLKGEKGEDGKSAFAIAVANGYTGSETEWLAYLHGADGKDGANGTDGKDGKDGKDGVDGKDGADGANGTNGEDGFTPIVTLEQLNPTTAKLTIKSKDGSTDSVQFGGLWEDAEEEDY